MQKEFLRPDYLFEVSWEVCNKVGGIHTVIGSKAGTMVKSLQDRYICVGPDVWKETHGNPEFIEDKALFRPWREQAAEQGIYLRIGRWQVPGQPLAMLVDFTPLFGQKDKIFTDYWLKFGLNSLSGQWDYTEPAMFGYAAGQLIESFYDQHLTSADRMVAHFHEWMTGTGVLYLKDKVPQAATLFTTHATKLGRSMATHGQDLYALRDQVDPEAKAQELGIVSKHSLERTAAQNADGFATVSPMTNRECKRFLGKEADVITPNGFDMAFVPGEKEFAEVRKTARKSLLEVAEGLLNQALPPDAFLVGHGGRYEYRNKGIDLLIQALAEMNRQDPKRTVVAFLLVPANQTGARPELLKRMEARAFDSGPLSAEYVTHQMAEAGHDPILRALKESGLQNGARDQVKLVFIPAYLNGSDGILNLTYYEALMGFDLTVFPSYYEPWGYTPLESLAFRIPTITTNLSGFGQWILKGFGQDQGAALVLDRDKQADRKAAANLGRAMLDRLKACDESTFHTGENGYHAHAFSCMAKDREMAGQMAQKALWNELIGHYEALYDLALKKVRKRQDLFKGKTQAAKPVVMPQAEGMRPVWKKINVEIKTPEAFSLLPQMTKNIWWTWNYEAEDLFARMDPALWETCNRNPNCMLEKLGTEHYEKLAHDVDFMEHYRRVSERFQQYMGQAAQRPKQQIAYLSMEYGLHQSIKIYSGGLGVLAGDYLKQASDDNLNMVAVGLMYRYGYFNQSLAVSGEQLSVYEPHNFFDMAAYPVRDQEGKWVKIQIAFPGRTLHARVWRIDVGRIPLYLLDTDIKENTPVDRFITHQLYGGDWENRFKQEFLLGIGGIRLLDALGLQPDIYHCNEGHAAFAGLERLRKYAQDEKLSFYEASEVVRASSLFTTHTPVPAGHDFFSEDMLRTYMPHYADRLGISWEAFMGLGKMNPSDQQESFSMSVLAAKLSQRVNGVSKIHGKVSREMFRELYPGYFPEELHIGHVTNGVHYGTWTAPAWQALYKETFGDDFLRDVSDAAPWKKIHDVPDARIWDMRNKERAHLLEYLKKRLLSNLSRRQETPRRIYQTMEVLDKDILTIGFARRFATYKRAHLIFNDLDRLSRIVNHPDMPIQFIYAGKAHPADKAGQDLIRHIVEISRKKEFRGRIIFMEDYDMELGAALTRGVDIWLNTPTRPQEASGTSGEKAVMNGVMNLSVMDGWWAEGYLPEAGWKLKEERTYEDQGFQNELDAETIYNILESQVAPMFYGRNKQGVPEEWVRWVKNCIAGIAPHFTNKRMLDDYRTRFYQPLMQSAEAICASDYQLARELTRWKTRVLESWGRIEILSKHIRSNSGKTLHLGESFEAEVAIRLPGLVRPQDLGIEVVFATKPLDGEAEVVSVSEMKQVEAAGDRVLFKVEVPARRTGLFNYAFRLFPKHETLPHRQDFSLVKWL